MYFNFRALSSLFEKSFVLVVIFLGGSHPVSSPNDEVLDTIIGVMPCRRRNQQDQYGQLFECLFPTFFLNECLEMDYFHHRSHQTVPPLYVEIVLNYHQQNVFPLHLGNRTRPIISRMSSRFTWVTALDLSSAECLPASPG